MTAASCGCGGSTACFPGGGQHINGAHQQFIAAPAVLAYRGIIDQKKPQGVSGVYPQRLRRSH